MLHCALIYSSEVISHLCGLTGLALLGYSWRAARWRAAGLGEKAHLIGERASTVHVQLSFSAQDYHKHTYDIKYSQYLPLPYSLRRPYHMIPRYLLSTYWYLLVSNHFIFILRTAGVDRLSLSLQSQQSPSLPSFCSSTPSSLSSSSSSLPFPLPLHSLLLLSVHERG